ncbi:MAG: hypothetical protein HY421_03055 [Candidatus Kerfeldbacteria bacterium]|nr:hypothetical protein [Candidatus Kerfeldbacteria bacterium]
MTISAWLWLGIEFGRVLIATFGLTHGLSQVAEFIQRQPAWAQQIAHGIFASWNVLTKISAVSYVTSLALAVLWLEFQRWYKQHRGRRSTDRLLVAATTFLLTVGITCFLTPYDWVLPNSTREAVKVLAVIHASSWISRMLHRPTRRAIRLQKRRRLRLIRRLVTALVRTTVDKLLGTNIKEQTGGRHVRTPGSNRRAA